MNASIAIDTSRRLGLISPLLYGLRGADTFKNDTPLMWVGPDSPIANLGGVRRGTVEALRKIQPGFMSGLVGAEWYRWQDGIGPRDQRPVRVSYWGRSAFEAANMEWRNEFGTEEFLGKLGSQSKAHRMSELGPRHPPLLRRERARRAVTRGGSPT